MICTPEYDFCDLYDMYDLFVNPGDARMLCGMDNG